jgi:hypothetical protein
VGTASGTVSLLDARSGALLRTVHTGGAPDEVSIFDARDGTLLRSLGAREGYKNSSVAALVVDERAGHAARPEDKTTMHAPPRLLQRSAPLIAGLSILSARGS